MTTTIRAWCRARLATLATAVRLAASWICLALVLHPIGAAAAATEVQGDAPLVVGGRTIHVFRAPMGAFTPADRAEGARRRILQAFEMSGEGWTSVQSQESGFMVQLDGKPMFAVLPGDVPKLSDQTAEGLANAASHVLRTAWHEARERGDPRARAAALLRSVIALALLVLALVLIWKLLRRIRDAVTARLARHVGALPDAMLASRMSPLFLGMVSRSCVLLAWLLSLLAIYLFLAYALDQFAYTRPMGEGLFHALTDLLLQSLSSFALALPGTFVAAMIFLVAWLCTQVSSELFDHVASGRMKVGMLDAHTAPATRHIVNAALWLFALAMAYPYLPGAQTEAFKGLSVIVGIMVSIGASGLVGQVASGVILVYTRALAVGEYVRIQDCEGTVTEMGLFVTRLRNGLGEEIALPNALVLGNVTRNLSREAKGAGFVLDTVITIGYDTPWRQVHALLVESARAVPAIARDPEPYVVQTALNDSYVSYRLVTCVTAPDPVGRAHAGSDLRASIQDLFNRHGVQIMSPTYRADPAEPKIVPESKWYAPPAAPPDRA